MLYTLAQKQLISNSSKLLYFLLIRGVGYGLGLALSINNNNIKIKAPCVHKETTIEPETSCTILAKWPEKRQHKYDYIGNH